MEDNYSLQNCQDDDVVAFGNSMFKAGRLTRKINESFGKSMGEKLTHELKHREIHVDWDRSHSNKYWGACESIFNDGVNCEILQLGSQTWKKGKMRIKVTVEFYAEEDNVDISTNQANINQPESPLDDLRRMINQER
ncbi:MAG: KGK domain-containing protein [Crinalium sp.]